MGTLLPWRLPVGWSAVEGTPAGMTAAIGPQHLGDRLAAPRLTVADWPQAAGVRLAEAARGAATVGREVQLLDEGRAVLHDGRPAARTLMACRQPDGLPLTVETWVCAATDGPGRVLLAASTPTPLWPLLGDRLRRLLASTGRVQAEAVPGPPEPLVALSPDGRLQVQVDTMTIPLQRRHGHVRWDDEPLHTGLLPHWLAAAAGLGPRPTRAVPPGLMMLTRPDLERCVAGDAGAVQVPSGPWAIVVAGFAGARRLAVAGPTGSCELLDAGEAGWWRLIDGVDVDDPTLVGLRAADPSAVWEGLVRACAA